MKARINSQHRFDSWMKLSVFIALLVFAVFLQLAHSSMANEVIFGIIGLAGGSLMNK